MLIVSHAQPFRLHALAGLDVQTARAAIPMVSAPERGVACRRSSLCSADQGPLQTYICGGSSSLSEDWWRCAQRRIGFAVRSSILAHAGLIWRSLAWWASSAHTWLRRASCLLVKMAQSPARRSLRGICLAGTTSDTENGGSGSSACAPLAMLRSGRKPFCHCALHVQTTESVIAGVKQCTVSMMALLHAVFLGHHDLRCIG